MKKVVKTLEIEQLSKSLIISKRQKKYSEKFGQFLDFSKICKCCKYCEHYAVARTPFDSKYRQMTAWSEVMEVVPCPCLNGVENEDGQKELVKGSNTCPNFKLNHKRCVQASFDLVSKARLEPVKDDDGNIISEEMTDKKINEYKDNIVGESEKIEQELEQVKQKLADLKERKLSLKQELKDVFVNRFLGFENSESCSEFLKILGEETYQDYEKEEKEKTKIEEAGYDSNKHRIETLRISSDDITRIKATSKDETYGGNFDASGIDKFGLSLNDYIGKQYSFEIEPYEVFGRGAKKFVRFRETEANHQKRKGNTILDLICGDNYMCWRFPAIEQPSMEENEIENENEDTEDDVEELDNEQTNEEAVNPQGEEDND